MQQLNAYFQAQLRERFAAPQTKMRHPALSKDTWALLRHKRMRRRGHRFRKQLEAKQYLWALFTAWRARVHHTAGPDSNRLRLWLKAVDRRASLHGRDMRVLQTRINAAFRQDMAAFTRLMWQEARAGGPVELARTLRAVLKAGRSYKPPRVDVALNVQGHLISDPAEISAVFGRTFAVSEQAVEVDFVALQQDPDASGVPSARIIADQMPSIATLAASFSALKPRKAAGLSRIPPDFYAAHPLGAAMTHAPLILKTLTRAQVPLLWGGCLSRPLLKPGKRPDDPKSYRAIALQEPASKATAKAMRPHLCACFESIALPGIGGARPGFALTVPALTVQAALACAQRDKRSIGVLFLDGVAAFYATSRASLFAHDRDELKAQLLQGPFDRDVVEAFLAFLPDNGALRAAGVSLAVVASLQASMAKTWYTTAPDEATVYRTSKGTIPGAPLADLLFQYVLHAAVSAMDFLLRRSGLAMAVTHGSVRAEAEPCSWLDDLTILVQSDAANSLADATIRAARLAHQCLGLIGIEVNYSPGKTEALLQWRGRGSKKVREQVLADNAGFLSLGELDGKCRSLKCTDNYTHLGSVRMAHAQACADLDRRADLARSVYRPLRSRILRNPELSVPERCHLLFSMVVSSYTHGLGTWSLATATEQRKFRGHYMQFLRGAVRPLHELPCRRLDDEQVCAILGALLPSEALAVSRIRAFSQVALTGSAFVKTALLKERVWLDAVCTDLAMLQKSMPTPAVKAFLAVPKDEMWVAWPFTARALSHTLKRFRKRCVESRQPLIQVALDKARLHHKLSEAGCLYVKIPSVKGGQRCVACADCGMVFSTASACAAHRRSVHGHRARASFGFGTACQVCAPKP